MKVDVAVVGGGLVGVSVASALAMAGLAVVVVEARPASPAPEGAFENRVSAISRASEQMLRRLGAWQQLRADRVGTFRSMRVWDRAGVGEVHFDSAEIGEPALGHIVENAALQHALERAAAALPGLTWLRPLALRSLELNDRGVVLDLGESRVEAALVVGADGTRSRVRELAGIACTQSDYDHHAVVATVQTELGHGECAWQRFLPGGPLAFLPLPGLYSSIVWSTAPAHAARLVDMGDDEFLAHITRAFESRLGAVTWSSARASFALHRLHATDYVAERVALVGDAAHTIHPLAGQGVNLGFYDAQALSQVISQARHAGRDFWRRAVLRRYARRRRGHNALMQGTMDAFYWLFASRWQLAVTARNLGLMATDKMQPLKRLIMGAATGLEGGPTGFAHVERGAGGLTRHTATGGEDK